MAAPGAPKKAKQVEFKSMNVNAANMESLHKYGANVRNMFNRNEHVNVYELSPIEEFMARTNYERSAENIRAGMVTPVRQIQNTSALAPPREVPRAPIKKRKTRRNRKSRSKSRSSARK